MREWEEHERLLLPGDGRTHAPLIHLDIREGICAKLSDVSSAPEEIFSHEEPADVFALGFHLKGGGSMDFGAGPLLTHDRDMVCAVVPRGARSTFHMPRQGVRGLSILLEPQLARELLAESRSFSQERKWVRSDVSEVRFTHRGTMGPQLVADLLSLFQCDYVGPVRTLFLESTILSILARQIGHEDPVSRPDITNGLRKRLCAARDFLEAHLDEPPTIATLARECGLNEFTLKREFKHIFGLTVFGYVRARRLELAARLIDEGLPVYQAALEVGYSCPSRFAKAFQRQHGVLPSAYRGGH